MQQVNSPFLERLGRLGIDAQPILSIFANLDLPLPQKGQYFVTSDEGTLVAINDAAVILRFSSNDASLKCHDIRHRNVIQPIVQLDRGALHVEILPGLKLADNYDDALKLAQSLQADHVIFNDKAHRVENIGYTPDNRAIVLDRNALTPGEGYVPHPDEELPLAHVRRMLAEAFHKACPRPFDASGQSNAAVFWQACGKMKKAGQLVAGWLDDKYNNVVYCHSHGQTSEVQKKSVAYAEAIGKYCEARDAAVTPRTSMQRN